MSLFWYFTELYIYIFIFMFYILVGDGQGGLVCCDSWGRKESDTTEQLNWTNMYYIPWKANIIYIYMYVKDTYIKMKTETNTWKIPKQRFLKAKKGVRILLEGTMFKFWTLRILEGWAGMKWKLLIQYHSTN